ncbi:MAG: ABC transporter ATP-binding protein [Candidatus Dormibacteria bacterium]
MSQVSKAYGARVAVDRLDLEVPAGELVAIVGPNGAGKTTTIEMMEGYRRPDRGLIRILGLDPARESGKVRPLVGLMLQEGGIYPSIKVGEALRLFSAYFRDPEPAAALLEWVGLADRVERRYRQLSTGEKQRLSLALALVGRPLVLFLDEPTAGMDPRARLLTWEIVKQRQRAGVTVILTTHSMEEAERLADRVAVIKDGALIAFDTPERLRGEAGPDLLHVQLREPRGAERLEAKARVVGAAPIGDRGQGAYELACEDPARTAADLASWLAGQGLTFNQMRIGRASLEEVFLSLTEESSK